MWTSGANVSTDGNELALAMEIIPSDLTCSLTVSCSGLAREKVKGLNLLGCCQEKRGMTCYGRDGDREIEEAELPMIFVILKYGPF